MKGQVFKIHSDFYYVNFNGEIYECKIREILKKQKEKICTGDYVSCSEVNETRKSAVIEEVLPRKNFLTRPDVANVEQVIVVSAVKEPELSFEQLNRYIAFAEYHNIPIKLCFNKNDLSSDDTLIEKVFSLYEPLGYEIVFTSALEKIGIEDLAELLENKTTVFCGSSGVGKSSLINAISPDLNLRTKSVSEKTQRGTHTTRHCEIVEIKKGGNVIRIIDTPGFSHLKFDFLLPQEIYKLFRDIKVFSGTCKYADCLHLHEDGCNVLEHLDKIDKTRYDSYTVFLEEARQYKEKIKTQGTKTETSNKNDKNKKFAKIGAKKREAARNTLKQKLNKHNIENDEENY